MKKSLTIIFVSLSAMLILDSMHAGHALVMFFLAGIVPGTNIVLSADTMFMTFTLLTGFTLSRLTLAAMNRFGKQEVRQSSKGTILSAQS